MKGRGLLADDVGLGKTMQALHYAKNARTTRYRKRHPIVVVCPAIVKYHWEVEARLHVNLRTRVLEGQTPKGLGIVKHPIIVINYDILGFWKEKLKKLKPWLVILDEGHYISNFDAQRTQNVYDLCEGVSRVIVLGATPLTSRPSQLFPILHLLRPDVFESFTFFGHKYCQPKKEYGRWVFKGARNLPKLHKLLKKHVMLRRMKEDVLKDLPKAKLMTAEVELSRSDMAEYKEAEQNFIRWCFKNRKGKLAKASKAIQMSKAGVLLQLSAQLKMKLMEEWIQEFLESTDRKLFVVGHHKKFLAALHKKFSNSILINGSVTGRKRKLSIEKFRHDPTCRLCFGNIQACGTGMNGLQFCCSDLLFGETTWLPADITQVIGRLLRLGQTDSVFVTFLVAKNTMESRRCGTLQSRKRILNAVLDGSEEGFEDFNVFDEVVKGMMRKAG